jgi:hypothetical protein
MKRPSAQQPATSNQRITTTIGADLGDVPERTMDED